MSDYAATVLQAEQDRIQRRLDEIAAALAQLEAEQATLRGHLGSVTDIATLAVAQAVSAAPPTPPGLA